MYINIYIFISLHFNSPHSTSLHLTPPLFTSIHLSSSQFDSLHFNSPLFLSSHMTSHLILLLRQTMSRFSVEPSIVKNGCAAIAACVLRQASNCDQIMNDTEFPLVVTRALSMHTKKPKVLVSIQGSKLYVDLICLRFCNLWLKSLVFLVVSLLCNRYSC